MARKKLSKAFQIAGLKKALKNRRTPKQFLPSMRKRLARLTAVVAILFVLCGCSQVHAQGQIYTIPQSTNTVILSAVNAPTTANITNNGQTVHFLTYTNTSPANLDIRLEASIDGTTFFPISDDATDSSTGVVIATGFYPLERVNLVKYSGSGTLTAFYSGASSTPANLFGAYSQSQPYRKIVAQGITSDSIYDSNQIATPFGSSQGTLLVISVGALSSTAQVTVNSNAANANALTSQTFTLNSSITIYSFNVPASPAASIDVSYSPGGFATTTLSMYYLFTPPGQAFPNSYTRITGTTATVLKVGPGIVHSVVVGTPAAGTISLFDLTPANCTATPSTNQVSVITATSTFPTAPEIYDTVFQNGICVKASAAMDITVTYQ